jgi:formylglycine-generating enzyme required for sulfatase activity
MIFFNKFKAPFFLIIAYLLFVSIAFAEIKVFEKEVEEIVGRDQSQEQVEAFALQKAKRLAVEEAGTYISSLTVVQNFRLARDEITALASGVTQSQVLGIPAVVLKNGVIHVTVKARISVDTSILDQQIKEIMKEKGTLKKLEDSQQKVRELENQLTNLKSSEVKRLEELNTQALAWERERERQRLALDEQVLKAQGEIKKAELERLQKEREMQERISKTITEQEKARKGEAEALAREQDRIRRAQLENEQRWNELARKAKLSESSWVPVDDSLSLKQAIEEAKQLKQEIASLIQRMNYQYDANVENLKKAYSQQISLTKPNLPPKPAQKDPFETTAEYNRRLADYDDAVKAAEKGNEKAVEKLRAEENFNLIKTETAYLKQKIEILASFVKRLEALQAKEFFLPEGAAMKVLLGEPEADQSRFPLALEYSGRQWKDYWTYTDRNQARDFYRTRTYLKAEGLFQLEERNGVSYRLTAARVNHPGTGEKRTFILEKPQIFSEISELRKMNQVFFIKVAEQEEAAKLNEIGVSSKTYRDQATGMEFVLVFGGCFQMGDTFGDGEENEKPFHEVCVDHYYLGKYEVTQGQWEKVMGNNPSYFTGKDNPVEQVSWNDVQKFIERLNSQSGRKYRLPTEAEWEYAARSGGKKEKWSGTSQESKLGQYAWYQGNSGLQTQPVGQKKPNGLGLYDMTGNVWEWCADWFDANYYKNSPKKNPQGPDNEWQRARRGGHKIDDPQNMRATSRKGIAPAYLDSLGGFRLGLSFRSGLSSR